MLSFSGFLDWISGEGKSLILIAAVFFFIVLAFKRQLIGAIGTFVVLLLCYIFVSKPTVLGTMAEWAAGLVGLG